MQVLAGPPTVRAVKQKSQHCGVASAETILRAYGNRARWTKQNVIGAAMCARLPEFKLRRPAASDAVELYYPRFKETYQTELAEYLIDHGYCVISTRKSMDKVGKPYDRVWRMLHGHLQQGHLAIIHLPGHYMVATGIDAQKELLYFTDPGRTEVVFSVPFAEFKAGESFHTKPSGDPRPGWDGRALIFWEGDCSNERDRCPVCRRTSPGKTLSFCRNCRAFVDRRENNRVQRVLDTIATCIIEDDITRINKKCLGNRLRRLEDAGAFSKADIRAALMHYPLNSDQPVRLETLHRFAASGGPNLEDLSCDDLVGIVTAQDRWQAVLRDRLENRTVRP